MNKTKWQELKEYVSLWRAMDWPWRFRNFVNLVDDPIDDIKHKIHGLRVFGMTFYLPRWLMRGSGEDTK